MLCIIFHIMLCICAILLYIHVICLHYLIKEVYDMVFYINYVIGYTIFLTVWLVFLCHSINLDLMEKMLLYSLGSFVNFH